MQYLPKNYAQINLEAGTYSPSTVRSYNNKSFWYWERSLFQRACSVLEFELPEEWSGSVRDFFLFCLFKYGYVYVGYSAGYGQFFQPGTLYGYDFYYQPTEFIVSNPRMNKRFKLGKDGSILKLTPDFMGIWDVIEYYAEKLSTLDASINMNIINSKYSKLFGARNRAGAQALKKMIDLINKGNPAVIFDKKIFGDEDSEQDPIFTYDSNLKENYILPELLQDFQTILSAFDNEIGIPTLPYQKKERMITSEADSKQIDSTARATVWVDTLNSSIDKIKEIFPDIKLSVKLRYEPEEGGTDGNSENNIAGDGKLLTE